LRDSILKIESGNTECGEPRITGLPPTLNENRLF
jgi:hypothetical protein